MLKLGITGGIGSGKTLVCAMFSQLGVPIYNADERAKWLVNHDEALKTKIIGLLGSQAFTNNLYNRAFVGSIVFSNPEKLKQLNTIIHPVVFNDWEKFCKQHISSKIVIKEAAIMFETDSKNTVDKIALVYSPLALRVKRVMQRDGVAEDVVLQKIKLQMPEEDKLKLAQYIIYNDEEHSLIEQVVALYNKLIQE